MSLARLCFTASLLCIAIHADSVAETITYRVHSGTGFFVSPHGHVITNAHVVDNCESVQVRGAVKPSDAIILATDTEHDLALLQTRAQPKQIAALRDNITGLKAGDLAYVMGYPGDRAVSGEYSLVPSSVKDLQGVPGKPGVIQFEDAAQKGNSGGPLLDGHGHVIGVVMGKSVSYRINKQTGAPDSVRQSDIAVSLNVLKDFMENNRVYAQRYYSTYDLTPDRIEMNARDFIVNVHCRLPANAPPEEEDPGQALFKQLMKNKP